MTLPISLYFLEMAVMCHAVYLNVKYRGGGYEPLPTTLPANHSNLNNLTSLLGGV